MLKMSNKIKIFIQIECSKWTDFEVIWLLFSTLVIIGISIKLRDNTMTLEQFLSYRSTNNLIMRSDRLAMELYV